MSSLGDKLDLQKAYRNWFDRAARAMPRKQAAEYAIGGEFHAYGVVQSEMLRFYGMRDEDYLVDVGCGSGRTAQPLAASHKGRYLGTDLVPELVDYARSLCNRPDWRFEVVTGLQIPEADGVADFVCMFSVLTHLLHEQSYLYLEDARRVLKPGGKIVFSFLEFRQPYHWDVFGATVEAARASNDRPLNVFIDRDAIGAWASHLDLKVEDIRDGHDAFVPLASPLTLEGGHVLEHFGNVGQSICVLSRPEG
ncbi:class I SAM-dependent methyltransferase [Phenylobacterium sp.]|uniref:class I SAM-dependent methyltransferase n=1 Tax=Phenylobacterium sp. TaxID=1871053 RepID=UPI0035B405E2